MENRCKKINIWFSKSVYIWVKHNKCFLVSLYCKRQLQIILQSTSAWGPTSHQATDVIESQNLLFIKVSSIIISTLAGETKFVSLLFWSKTKTSYKEAISLNLLPDNFIQVKKSEWSLLMTSSFPVAVARYFLEVNLLRDSWRQVLSLLLLPLSWNENTWPSDQL